MSKTPDPAAEELATGFVAIDTAPFIYFDFVPTHGVLNGAIQIELAARTMAPTKDGGVRATNIEVGRLRCSPIAAQFLRDASKHCVEHPRDNTRRLFITIP